MKTRLLYIFPFVLAIGCFVAYSSIGSYVDDNGILVEPFGFIPVGIFFLVIGMIIAVAVEISIYYKKKNQE